jgi:hypothetical protein
MTTFVRDHLTWGAKRDAVNQTLLKGPWKDGRVPQESGSLFSPFVVRARTVALALLTLASLAPSGPMHEDRLAQLGGLLR